MLQLSTGNPPRDFADALDRREPFRTYGALRGLPASDLYTFGWLPADWVNTFTARRHVIDYVVMSYATPIAWHDTEAGWIVPDERYSATTSRHQSRIAAAVAGLEA